MPESSEVIDPLGIADALVGRIREVKESTGAESVRISVEVREGKVELDVVRSD